MRDQTGCDPLIPMIIRSLLCLTSHQLEISNSTDSPRVIIQGVVLLTPIGGWSTVRKPLCINLDSVDDRPDPPLSCQRRETGEIGDNDAQLGFPGEL